ncbi:MAG: hypothetical protein JO022_21770, partial [Acidobacteriaceae bacterium]|nr:hypothetical protein [Acidobacteriaceae bacterium]
MFFLDFVVNAALEGHFESLKERTIGVEVFNRDPNYDTNQDPVVRGTASEVRKRLAQYYQIPGHERELRIDLPAGSYLPEFHCPAESIVVAPPTVVSSPPRGAHWRWPVWVAILAALAIGLFAANFSHRAASAVDQFWAPMLGTADPVLLCVGQPKVYNLIGSLEVEMEKAVPAPGTQLSRDAANQKIPGTVGQIVPNWDRYLALGDAICLSDVASLLARRGRVYHVRGGGSTTFADLRENPAVLIGGFTNDW